MSVEEYELWAREYRTHPWGERFMSAYLAQIPYAVVNFSGKTLQKGKDVPLNEFILDFDPDHKPVEVDPFTHFSAMTRK
jgi:hypothetical protein